MISSRVKIGMHKNRKIRCLFRRKVLGTVPWSSILYKFRKSSIRKEHVCFKYFFGISAEKKKKRRKKGHMVCLISAGKESFLSYFLVKRIPLSRRVEYVMGGWISGSAMYVCHTNQIGSTINTNQISCYKGKCPGM